MGLLSVTDFAAKIKAKYPDYATVDDTTLVQKIVAKYPEYAAKVDTSGLGVKAPTAPAPGVAPGFGPQPVMPQTAVAPVTESTAVGAGGQGHAVTAGQDLDVQMGKAARIGAGQALNAAQAPFEGGANLLLKGVEAGANLVNAPYTAGIAHEAQQVPSILPKVEGIEQDAEELATLGVIPRVTASLMTLIPLIPQFAGGVAAARGVLMPLINAIPASGKVAALGVLAKVAAKLGPRVGKAFQEAVMTVPESTLGMAAQGGVTGAAPGGPGFWEGAAEAAKVGATVPVIGAAARGVVGPAASKVAKGVAETTALGAYGALTGGVEGAAQMVAAGLGSGLSKGKLPEKKGVPEKPAEPTKTEDPEQQKRESAYQAAMKAIGERKARTLDEVFDPFIQSEEVIKSSSPEAAAEFSKLKEESYNKVGWSPGATGTGTGQGVLGRGAYQRQLEELTSRPELTGGEPVTVVEYDFGNLGGSNLFFDHNPTNETIFRVEKIMADHLMSVPGVKKVVVNKLGGDEKGATIIGGDPTAIKAAVDAAHTEIENYRKTTMLTPKGGGEPISLADITHPKHDGMKTGTAYVSTGMATSGDIATYRNEIAALYPDAANWSDAKVLSFHADYESGKATRQYLDPLAAEQGFVFDEKSKTYKHQGSLVGKGLTEQVQGGILSKEEALKQFSEHLDKLKGGPNGQGQRNTPSEPPGPGLGQGAGTVRGTGGKGTGPKGPTPAAPAAPAPEVAPSKGGPAALRDHESARPVLRSASPPTDPNDPYWQAVARWKAQGEAIAKGLTDQELVAELGVDNRARLDAGEELSPTNANGTPDFAAVELARRKTGNPPKDIGELTQLGANPQKPSEPAPTAPAATPQAPSGPKAPETAPPQTPPPTAPQGPSVARPKPTSAELEEMPYEERSRKLPLPKRLQGDEAPEPLTAGEATSAEDASPISASTTRKQRRPKFGKTGLASEAGGATGQTRPTFTAPESDAMRAQKVLDRMDKDIKDRFGFKWRKAVTGFLHKWVDVGSEWKVPLLRDAKAQDVIMAHDLHRGASGEASRQMDETKKSVFGDFPIEDVKMFGQYAMMKRVVELGNRPDIKHPYGLTAKEAQAYLDNLKENNGPEWELFERKAEDYRKVYTGQLDQLVENGLMTKPLRDKLVAEQPWYNPRKFIQHIDPDGPVTDKGGKVTQAHDSGIKALEEGSDEALVTNPVFLMGQVIARTQARIFKNRASNALHEYVSSTPENPLGAKVDKPTGTDKYGQATFGKEPTGFTRVFSMKDGKRQAVLMPNEVAKSWTASDPQINSDVAAVLGWLSGTKIIKPIATGYNPAFIVTNVPRDIFHSWLTTKVYHPVLPVGLAQLGTDMVRVLPDVLKRTGRVKDYIKQGGSMDFLTNQGQFKQEGWESLGMRSSVGEAFRQVMGYLGESSELLVRMAMRDRALKRGMTPEQATHLARNYIDFAQGGSWAKAADTVVPYFNAAIQGTRGVFRAFRTDPATATFKTAQIIAAGASLAYWNEQMNKECWDSISPREKASKWIITTPLWYKDKTGEKRYVYMGIAKDQAQAVFAAIGEGVGEKMRGGKFNGERLWMALDNLTPVDQQTLFSIPLVAATGAYFFNKDFWLNDDVWKGRQVSPSEEYTPDTPKEWVKVGAMSKQLKDRLGLPEVSPERAKRAASKILPDYNPLVGLMGGALSAVTGTLPAKQQEQINKPILAKMSEQPVLNRIIRTTWPTRASRESVEEEAARLHVPVSDASGKEISVKELRRQTHEAKIQQNDKRIELDRQIDLGAMNIISDPATTVSLQNKMKTLEREEPEEYKRLLNRLRDRWPEVYNSIAPRDKLVEERKDFMAEPSRLRTQLRNRKMSREDYEARIKEWRSKRTKQLSPTVED